VLLDGLTKYAPHLHSLLAAGGQLGGRVLKANVEALERLQNWERQQAPRDCSLLWPRLKLVSCWGDASSASWFRKLALRFPQAAFQRKGLLATEGVITIPDCAGDPSLCIHSGFYEFLDKEGRVRLAGELCAGDSYQVILTTASGLYRYQTGDIVLCDRAARGSEPPILRFIGRTGISSDLVGEKLTEAFVSQCLIDVEEFAVLVPSFTDDAPPACYSTSVLLKSITGSLRTWNDASVSIQTMAMPGESGSSEHFRHAMCIVPWNVTWRGRNGQQRA
jgi:hypothetical protein